MGGKNGRVLAFPGDNGATPPTPEDNPVLSALQQSSQMNREMAGMFAALLKSKHKGKAFVSKALAEECYGDAQATHGWLVSIQFIEPLQLFKIRAFTPDERPYVAPDEIEPGSAREWLAIKIENHTLPIFDKLDAEVLNQLAALLEEFKGVELKAPEPVVAAPVPVPAEASEEETMCEGDWHKNPVGLRCPQCGSKKVVEQEAVISA